MKADFTTKLSGHFKEIDRYSQPIQFNIQGDESLKSTSGALVSLAVIVFLATQFFIQFREMVNYDGPQIIQMNEFQNDPGFLNLTQSNNFIFAISVTANSANVNMSQNSLISFSATYSQNIRNSNGTTTKYRSLVNWAPCQASNFPDPVLGAGVYSQYSLEYAYCPTRIDFTAKDGSCPAAVKSQYPNCQTPPNFKIRGTYLSNDFEFVQLKFTECQPSHAAHIADLHCASNSNIASTFNSSEIKINLYYTNVLINPVNYQTPNKSYIDSLYWTINPSVSKLADVFLDQQTVQDYDSFLYSDNSKNSSFYSIESETMREIQVFQSNYLLELNLRRSSINRVTKRTYTKILDVVSNIGGISEIMFLLGGLILLNYINYKYKMTLSNELYDFEPSEHDQKRQKEEHLEPNISAVSQKPNEDLSQLSESKRELQNDTKDIKEVDLSITMGALINPIGDVTIRESILKKIFSRKRAPVVAKNPVKSYFDLLSRRKKLKYDEFQYIKTLSKWMFCRKKNTEEQLAQKAQDQITKDVDIITIIEKLKEIEKMKLILLNRNQREVFNFIDKPLLTLKSDIAVHKTAPSSLQSLSTQLNKDAGARVGEASEQFKEDGSLSKYARLYSAYRSLKNDEGLLNSKCNQKLIEMMGEDLIRVFKRMDQEMGDEVDLKKFEDTLMRIIRRPNRS